MESATLVAEMDDVAAAAVQPIGAPASARIADFVALTKPRMNFLVVVTTGVGYFMAARGSGEWGRLINTLVGTALTAAGASVLNQYSERELDSRMVRTQDRPLPAGRVMPIEALIWGVLLATVGTLELLLFVNPLTAALAAFTLATYVFLYTPLKRVSTLCTIVGAVPGAVPILMGWTAVRSSLSPEAIALFGIMFLWQMPHFLAIAILYREDYVAGGFKMLPVVDPTLRTTAGQIVLYAAALIPVSLLPTLLQTAGVIYLTAAIFLGLIFAGFGALRPEPCSPGSASALSRVDRLPAIASARDDGRQTLTVFSERAHRPDCPFDAFLRSAQSAGRSVAHGKQRRNLRVSRAERVRQDNAVPHPRDAHSTPRRAREDSRRRSRRRAGFRSRAAWRRVSISQSR